MLKRIFSHKYHRFVFVMNINGIRKNASWTSVVLVLSAMVVKKVMFHMQNKTTRRCAGLNLPMKYKLSFNLFVRDKSFDSNGPVSEVLI